MYQFEIRKDCIKEVRKTMLKKGVVFSLFVVAVIFLAHFKNPNIYATIIAITIMVGGIIWGFNKVVNRQMILYESFILTIDRQSINREQYDTPDIVIKTSDISRIIKNRNGSYSIKGSSPGTKIEVPAEIENFERLENALSGIMQISKKTGIQFEDLVMILALGSFAAVLISEDKTIIAVCGAIVLIISCYSFYLNRQNQNIDSQSKVSWWHGIFFIIWFIKNIYEQLNGQ